MEICHFLTQFLVRTLAPMSMENQHQGRGKYWPVS